MDEDETFPELMYSPYQLSGGGPQPQATTGGEAAGAPAPEPQPAPHHHYPQYVTSCYPFVQEQVYHPHVYFNPLHAHTHASPNLAYSSQVSPSPAVDEFISRPACQQSPRYDNGP